MSNTKDLPELQVFKTVLYYCICIVAMPLVSFFVSKNFIFDGLLGLSSVQSNIWAAIVAIVALHIALGAFIYRAYFGGQTKPPSKAD
ncbi:vacuolar ATPase assembly integral membrane protein VMA21 homolog [Venturia canescens]|uniref:vacuolar ATPase assembly integral membrane protein VMA21 homolog n=1 Tax=Venturia canescens TaxID=32260 RepID=UPI001C9D4A53|nr:vacuolar ATPase assembly integral membrane protein VMA21 homolog [Venturia canescens]